ncbi:MAG: 16S rRNA (cytidine(1402)-2'-O)-methyltransferase [Candidatus Woesearchaeota archaeon]
MTLYLISTPIGNLEDISFRALKMLKESDLILAEDTRRTVILLNKYDIKNKQESFNDNNKEKKTRFIIDLLKEGKQIALVSDSGTPGISDPGFYLTRECVKNNIQVSPIPGPNAAISALISSGFATDRFTFLGFMPKKEKARSDILSQIKDLNTTFIIYESPYRIHKTLKAMSEIIPDRNICIAREMTKKFEEFIRGTSTELYNNLKNRKIKGEITIVVDKI